MPFEDLLLPNARIVTGETFNYTVDTTFYLPVVVQDADDSIMSFATGYTATMTLNLPDDTNVLTFTNVATGGRQINLAASANKSLVVTGTDVGMAAVEPYTNRALSFNLIVRRTSDGFAADVLRSCYLRIFNDLD